MPRSSRRLGAERRAPGSQHGERRAGGAGARLGTAPAGRVWEVGPLGEGEAGGGGAVSSQFVGFFYYFFFYFFFQVTGGEAAEAQIGHSLPAGFEGPPRVIPAGCPLRGQGASRRASPQKRYVSPPPLKRNPLPGGSQPSEPSAAIAGGWGGDATGGGRCASRRICLQSSAGS